MKTTILEFTLGLSTDRKVIKYNQMTVGIIFAELAGFFVFIYGLFYVLYARWFKLWANFEFLRKTFYLRHTQTVHDRLSGQQI